MCSVAQVSFHSAYGSAGESSLRLSVAAIASILVHKIGKRLFHTLEHLTRFVLSDVEPVADCAFRGGENIACLITWLKLRRTVDFLRRRAGEEPFRARDIAAARADMDRTDGTTGLILQCNNPHRIAAFIRPQGIVCSREGSA